MFMKTQIWKFSQSCNPDCNEWIQLPLFIYHFMKQAQLDDSDLWANNK